MHGIKAKRLTEADQYEPLSQQIYTDLVAAIDKLFDALKNDLSTVFNLHWEWQKIVLTHGRTLCESHTPVPLHVLVSGKKLINELRYDIRENADTVIKINKVIELYRDRMKDLVKKEIFKPKQPSPEEAYQQFGTSVRQSPAWQNWQKGLESGTDNFLAQQKIEADRMRLEKERQEFEAQKAAAATPRGTGGAKAPPDTEPKVEPAPTPATNTATNTAASPPAENKAADPLKTASPDTTDPAQRLRVIKLGQIVFTAMRFNKNQQVDPKQVAEIMKKKGYDTLDKVEIDHLDPQMQEKALKAGEAYLALHGGGVIGELETGLDPLPPEQAKGIEELLTFTNKKLVEYLAGAVGQAAVDQVLGEFGGKVPRGTKKQDFIQKVLALQKPATEAVLTLVQTLRNKLRCGVRPVAKLYLEGIEPEKKVGYLKEKLRSR